MWEEQQVPPPPLHRRPPRGAEFARRSCSIESSVKMWGPAHLSVALPIVLLQILASSSHARPQTGHEVLFKYTHSCIAISSIAKMILKCKRVQVGPDERASRVLVPSAVPNCDSVFRRSLPECQQKVLSVNSSNNLIV